MKTFIRSLFLLVLALNSQAGLSQEPDNKRTGAWMGILNAGGTQLRLVFNIDVNANGQFTATYSEEGGPGYGKDVIDQIQDRITGSISEPSYAWLRFFTMFDPSSCFETIKCPVLALNGERDTQVLAEKNIAAIREGLISSGNQKVTALVLPGLNHLFQNCGTGLPSEYGRIEETFDPETLIRISDWILQQLD